MKPRELVNEIMAAIYDRGPKGAPHGRRRDVALGGGLVLDDITGHAGVDRHVVGFMLRYLNPGDTMIDVGANIGLYSVLAGAILGPRGRVEAFEPSPTLRPCLEANIKRNGLTNIRVHPKLAGGRRMIDPFVDGIGRSGRRRVPGRREWVRARNLLQISSIQLDEVVVGRRYPWRLHRMLFAFPVGAHNLISQRLARRADAA